MRRFGVLAGIRTVAIGMIIFPEPVTTVLGVLILGATFTAARQKSLKKFGDLDGLIRRSIRNNQPRGFRRCFTNGNTVVEHHIKQEGLAQSLMKSEKSQPIQAPLQYHDWFDNRKVSDAVIFHTLKTSFPQYEATSENVPVALRKAEKAVEFHRLKQDLLS